MEENFYLRNEVYNEHVAGFEKGIAQCNYFFKVSLDHTGYNVMKMVVESGGCPAATYS